MKSIVNDIGKLFLNYGCYSNDVKEINKTPGFVQSNFNITISSDAVVGIGVVSNTKIIVPTVSTTELILHKYEKISGAWTYHGFVTANGTRSSSMIPSSAARPIPTVELGNLLYFCGNSENIDEFLLVNTGSTSSLLVAVDNDLSSSSAPVGIVDAPNATSLDVWGGRIVVGTNVGEIWFSSIPVDASTPINFTIPSTPTVADPQRIAVSGSRIACIKVIDSVLYILDSDGYLYVGRGNIAGETFSIHKQSKFKISNPNNQTICNYNGNVIVMTDYGPQQIVREDYEDIFKITSINLDMMRYLKHINGSPSNQLYNSYNQLFYNPYINCYTDFKYCIFNADTWIYGKDPWYGEPIEYYRYISNGTVTASFSGVQLRIRELNTTTLNTNSYSISRYVMNERHKGYKGILRSIFFSYTRSLAEKADIEIQFGQYYDPDLYKTVLIEDIDREYSYHRTPIGILNTFFLLTYVINDGRAQLIEHSIL